MAELPPILRTLLITDGTVTRSLEAYFWEPIEIEQVSLESTHSKENIPWLKALAHEELLIRKVKLVGKTSNTVYATAYSVVRLNKIPVNIRDQLKHGGIGIGVLIRQFAVESYREILDIGYCHNLSFTHKEEGKPTHTNVAYRSYRIMVEKEPAILITEKFPKAAYR